MVWVSLEIEKLNEHNKNASKVFEYMCACIKSIQIDKAPPPGDGFLSWYFAIKN